MNRRILNRKKNRAKEIEHKSKVDPYSACCMVEVQKKSVAKWYYPLFNQMFVGVTGIFEGFEFVDSCQKEILRKSSHIAYLPFIIEKK